MLKYYMNDRHTRHSDSCISRVCVMLMTCTRNRFDHPVAMPKAFRRLSMKITSDLGGEIWASTSQPPITLKT